MAHQPPNEVARDRSKMSNQGWEDRRFRASEQIEFPVESANDPIYSKDALANTTAKPAPQSGVADHYKKLQTPKPKSTSFATNIDRTLRVSDASYAMSHMTLKIVRDLKENLWVKEGRF